jgi:hypothetical protein
MTESDDSQTATRPISVAELLAKNGTLGAPPVTGRRRRRRGNADAVTVAELTGEIPIIGLDEDFAAEASDADPVAHPSTPPALAEKPVARRGPVGRPELSHDPRPHRGGDAVDRVSEIAADESYDLEVSDLDPSDSEASGYESSNPASRDDDDSSGAELMSPDPVDISDGSSAVRYGQPDELGLADVSYSDTAASTLFGGDSLADELSRGNAARSEVADDPVDLDAAEPDGVGAGPDEERYADGSYYDYEQPSRGGRILRGLLTVVQSVVAVVFGAGLFLAFDQLWKWNSLVAMVLAVLVTLGLVTGVWVVRKTEDIASTLIAVGVGLMVTFGPLALMHAG